MTLCRGAQHAGPRRPLEDNRVRERIGSAVLPCFSEYPEFD
jgi:hypothetical protein